MHQLVQDVLPYFAAFYVLDSLAVVRAHELLLLRPWRRFRLGRAGAFLAGLAPHSEVVCALELPLRLGRERVAWPSPDGWTAVAWSALGPLAVEQRVVRSAAGPSLRAPSPEAARHLAQLLAALRDTPPAQRWARAQALADAASDVEAVRALRARQLRHAGPLALLGWTLLVGVFGLLPATVFTRLSGTPDAPPAPLVVLAALAPVYVVLAFLAWRTLRACGLSRSAAANTLSTLAFFPPAAAHVRSLLGRALYVAFDPLAVAAALLPAPAFADHARERHHRARLEGAGEPAVAELAEHAELSARIWTRAVRAAGLEPAEVLRPPRTLDPAAGAYCPLCSAAYRPGFGTCSDCRVALEPLCA